MKPTRALTASVAVVALLGVGCSSKAKSASTTTAPAASGKSVTSGTSVDIKDFAFSPKALTAKVGATVTWTNDDGNAHTVTVTDGPEKFDSKNLAPGKKFTHTFAKAGTYAYQCGIHNYMKGTVTVS